MDIVQPITQDRLVGFDRANQLIRKVPDDDGSCIYTRVHDVRNKICQLCGRGWELTGPGFGDQRFIPEMEKLVHKECLTRNTAWDQFWTIHQAFVEAKMRFNGLKEIPNQYWSAEHNPVPWYTTAPLDHAGILFTVGRRKNVWSIEVGVEEDLVTMPKGLSAAFDGDDVTKHFGTKTMLIHAWGKDKLQEYIRVIVSHFGLVYVIKEPA